MTSSSRSRRPRCRGERPEIITSAANERVRYVRSLSQAQTRRRDRAYVVEGVRLVEEAVRAGIEPRLVLVAPVLLRRTGRGEALLDRLREHHPVEVSERALASAADTPAPQGVLAVLPRPEERVPAELGGLVLLLDGIRDPGNLGTILRSAAASGVAATVALLDCADAYGPKAVRAAMGAHFRLAMLTEATWQDLGALTAGRPIWLANMRDGLAYEQVDWRPDSALIVGGEAAGAGTDARRLATGAVSIPMAEGAESLNAAVAASILLFEAARQRRAPRHD